MIGGAVAQAGGVAGAVAPPQAANPAAYSRNPFAAQNRSAIIDFATKEGKKYYENATKPLFNKDQAFDVEPDKFRTFISLLTTRAKDLGFLIPGTGICMVPPDPNQPNQGLYINIIKDYGSRTLDDIRSWEGTFSTWKEECSRILRSFMIF